MEKFKMLPLSEIAELVIDYRGKTPKKLGGDWSVQGYRAISAKNVKTRQIVQSDSIRYLDESLYRKWMKRGDILITSEAPFGQLFYWDSDEKIVLSQRLFALRCKKEFYSPYIFHYMTSDAFQSDMECRATGTTVTGLRQPELLKCRISVPSFEKQKIIADTLSTIDAKIENNKRINHHLELMAQAIFKSWFIDYENSTDFVETEIGMIPSSWKVVSLSEIAEISNGYSYKGRELKESSTAMATIKNFDRNGGFKSNGFKELVPSDKIKPTHFVSINEILIAHTDLTQNADIIGNSEILLNDFGYDAIVASMDLVKINSKISGISNYTLLLMTKNELFKQYCLGFVNGTTVLHLSKKAVPNYKLAIPSSEKIFKEFNSLVEPLFERMKVVIKETESLISLRDSLLPKLMSGEIKVCDYAAK